MTKYPTKLRDSLPERLWQRVDKTESCWNWTGKRSRKGYGQIRFQGQRILVHRVSWELAYGPIPPGQYVLHRCDNPSCVRPDHLFLGSLADNNHDMDMKGRSRRIGSPGEKNSASKLTDEQVQMIRDTHKPRDRTYGTTALARQFNVTIGAIQRVVHHHTWKHV